MGLGFLVSVGYMDPGNWATDVAGGSTYGFTLLIVILLANFCAMFLQVSHYLQPVGPAKVWIIQCCLYSSALLRQ